MHLGNVVCTAGLALLVLCAVGAHALAPARVNATLTDVRTRDASVASAAGPASPANPFGCDVDVDALTVQMDGFKNDLRIGKPFLVQMKITAKVETTADVLVVTLEPADGSTPYVFADRPFCDSLKLKKGQTCTLSPTARERYELSSRYSVPSSVARGAYTLRVQVLDASDNVLICQERDTVVRR